LPLKIFYKKITRNILWIFKFITHLCATPSMVLCSPKKIGEEAFFNFISYLYEVGLMMLKENDF